ncbi:MAG: dihydrofolate reductase [Cyclobacteriaceae bacterium]|nr:dihydrofolate reductase [Cyclobacteriaceae bacterium]
MMEERKLILYIACSLDGYIAGPNDDLSFLSIVEKEGEDYGYSDFIQSVDTIIMGRRTYDWVMKNAGYFPHSDKEVYIISKTLKSDEGNINFYSEKLPNLVRKLKGQKGKHIFCDGGAQIVHQLLQNQLIDEIILSVIPVLLGEGLPLFQSGSPKQRLELKQSQHFESGLVQLHYKIG